MRKCGLAKPGLTEAKFKARMAKTAAAPLRGGDITVGVPSGAPAGSWRCRACNNLNYPGRDTCNGSKGMCGRPRSEAAVPTYAARPMYTAFPAVAPMISSRPAGGGNAPAGAWQCVACGNVNWPSRTECNGNNCGRPRDEVDGGPPPHVPRPPTYAPMHTPSYAVALPPAAKPQRSPPPEGSWVCVSCGNTNWPTRTSCNGKGCSRPREEVDGGPPDVIVPPEGPPLRSTPPPMSLLRERPVSSAPPGSWTCVECGNVNWPSRTECNGKNCGQPRAEVDGGEPLSDQVQAMPRPPAPEPPEGSWTCPHCENVNWPTRTSCNKRGCGIPRGS